MIKKILISIVILLFTQNVFAEVIEGRVVGVSDGDTITILDSSNIQHKIRLSGIDAPEKQQPFGQRSKQALSDLIYNKTIQVEWSKQDRYGRIVGKVLVNNTDMNLEQVKRGLAWHYKKYQKEQPFDDRLAYTLAQEDAMRKKVGLWQEPDVIAPWDWRKASR